MRIFFTSEFSWKFDRKLSNIERFFLCHSSSQSKKLSHPKYNSMAVSERLTSDVCHEKIQLYDEPQHTQKNFFYFWPYKMYSSIQNTWQDWLKRFTAHTKFCYVDIVMIHVPSCSFSNAQIPMDLIWNYYTVHCSCSCRVTLTCDVMESGQFCWMCDSGIAE